MFTVLAILVTATLAGRMLSWRDLLITLLIAFVLEEWTEQHDYAHYPMAATILLWSLWAFAFTGIGLIILLDTLGIFLFVGMIREKLITQKGKEGNRHATI